MVAELRHLVFSQQEAATAVFEFSAYRGQRLPKGSVKSFVIQDGEPPQLRLEVVMEGSGKTHLAEFVDDDVIEALVLFCRARKIPIPKHATKTARKIGNTIALVVAKNIPAANVDTARQMLLNAG